MRVTNAVWEERNLGVTCHEVTVEPGDSPPKVLAVVDDLPRGYHVVKVPVAGYDVMSSLERAGFSFIESSVRVGHDLIVEPPSGIFGRMVAASECVELDAAGIERVGSEIRRGIFTTDRVYLDPNFTAERAASRYVNWMYDELERGGSVHELRVSQAGVGFFVFREDSEGTGYSVLSGLYEAAKSPGFGSVLLHKILLEAKGRGLRRLASHISTNNLAVVKTHVDQGFAICDIHYVYVRLNSG